MLGLSKGPVFLQILVLITWFYYRISDLTFWSGTLNLSPMKNISIKGVFFFFFILLACVPLPLQTRILEGHHSLHICGWGLGEVPIPIPKPRNKYTNPKTYS